MRGSRRFVERVWFGDEWTSAAARGALWPLAGAYRAVVAARGALYSAGVLPSHAPVIPTISVGNLTAGGTGKTPVAALIAARLATRARPAIVLRGYGDDEVEVHRTLNPGMPVVVAIDRVTGVRAAAARGADVAVLDDAFQHRRVRRTADVVLISVEQVLRPRRLLPAGPWREPLSAARRADLIVLTRKSAGPEEALEALAVVQHAAPAVPVAVMHLAPAALVDAVSGAARPLDFEGAAVHAIAAVGEPDLFRIQLEQVTRLRPGQNRVALSVFPDHHDFTDVEIAALARSIPPDALALCTLKDAVKLGPRWPGPSRLWYVSQQLLVEQGQEDFDRLLQRVLDARPSTSSAAG